MRYVAAVLSAGMGVLLCSCATPPEAMVRTVIDVPSDTGHSKVVIVSDTARQFGKAFGESFNDNLRTLTQESKRDVSMMQYIDFIRSPYNEPDKKSSFSDTLFVFIAEHGSKSSEYGVYAVTFVVEMKLLNKEPFVRQEIMVGIADPLFSSKAEAGAEFAKTIYHQLQTRNLL